MSKLFVKVIFFQSKLYLNLYYEIGGEVLEI